MRNADKLRERKLISKAQRGVGLGLIIAGVLIGLVCMFGYLAGYWQIAPFADMTDQVFIAREVALSAGTGITGAFDMDGEESGVHVYYASLSEDDAINVEDFDTGETKKALKGGSLQFPATKERQTLVIEEAQPVTLSNGLIALSGGILTEYQGFADVKMGQGSIVIGLAAVIIGEVLAEAILGKRLGFVLRLAFTVIGAIVYYFVYVFVLWLKFPADDMKLLTAIVVACHIQHPGGGHLLRVREGRYSHRAGQRHHELCRHDPAAGPGADLQRRDAAD